MTVRVRLDGFSGVTLEAEYVLEETWNGWLQPIATREALEAFISACRAAQPDGDWGAVDVFADLLLVRRDEDDDEFSRADTRADGIPLYNLSGWTWVMLIQ